jgi:hypothetical protein
MPPPEPGLKPVLSAFPGAFADTAGILQCFNYDLRMKMLLVGLVGILILGGASAARAQVHSKMIEYRDGDTLL